MERNAAAERRARKERFLKHQRALRVAFLLTLVSKGAAYEEAERCAAKAMNGKAPDGTERWHKVKAVMERYGFDYERMDWNA